MLRAGVVAVLIAVLMCGATAAEVPSSAAQLVAARFADALQSGSVSRFQELAGGANEFARGDWREVLRILEETDCIAVRSLGVHDEQGTGFPREIELTIEAHGIIRSAGHPALAVPRRWFLTIDARSGEVVVTRAETDDARTARLLLDASTAERDELLRRAGSDAGVAAALARRPPVLTERPALASAAMWLLARENLSPAAELHALALLGRLSIIDGDADAALERMEDWLARHGDAAPALRARAALAAADAALVSTRQETWPSHIDAAVCLIDHIAEPALVVDILSHYTYGLMEQVRFGPEVVDARRRLFDLSQQYGWRIGLARAELMDGLFHRTLHHYALAREAFTRAFVHAHEAGDSSEAARTSQWLWRQIGGAPARAWERDALVRYTRTFAPEWDVDAHVNALAMEALTALAEGRRTEADAFLEELLDLAPAAEEFDTRRDAWLAAVRIHRAHGRYEQAVAAAEESLREGRAAMLWTAWATKNERAKNLQQLGRLEEAIEDLRDSIELIEARRSLLPNTPVGGARYFQDKFGAYNRLADCLVQVGRDREALQIVERGRAGAMTQLLDAITAGRPAGAPAEAERMRLHQRLVAVNREILGSRTKSAKLARELAAAREALERYEIDMAVARPETALRGERRLPLSEIRNVPSPGTAVLEYMIAEDEQRTRIFVVTRDRSGELRVQTRAARIDERQLAAKARRAGDAVSQRSAGAIPELRELYDVLIRPVEDLLAGYDQICIIPEAALWRVPFAALENANGAPLVERFAIHYAPSLSALELSARSRRTDVRSRALVAVANPVSAKLASRPEFPRLAAAEEEVRQVAALYAEGAVVRLAERATESFLKSKAPDARFVHVAAHGVVDRDAMYSALLLAGDDGEDGLLEAREVLDMRLNADLVVLSACETARGQQIDGEGVIALSWAFMAAGARGVVASQWKVESESTAGLMTEFHRQMVERGLTPAQALRRAQLATRRNPSRSHPFYWAAFSLIGEGAPPRRARPAQRAPHALASPMPE